MNTFIVLVSVLILVNLDYSYSFTYYNKCSSSSDEKKTVQTLNGPIKGECYDVPVSYANGETINNSVYYWLSIPFAEKPIGSRRFLKPEPIGKWNKTLNTDSWPRSCLQFGLENTSEDCLYINVVVRGEINNAVKKPVMVWFYGGGFTIGGSGVSVYDPGALISATDVIFVSFNYRLNIYGFLYLTDSEIAGNAGFLDQRLALKWIHENIGVFGGDNSKITLFGQSAGAWSIGFHLFHPPSWPYFRNAILESGSPTGSNNIYQHLTANDADNRSKEYLKAIGCNGTQIDEIVSCLKTIDIASFNQADIYTEASKINFTVIDNKVFYKTVNEMALAGDFKKCNIITGFTSDEQGGATLYYLGPDIKELNYNQFYEFLKGALLAPGQVMTEEWINQIYLEYFKTTDLQNLPFVNYKDAIVSIKDDNNFKCPSFNLAETFTKSGLNAYVYEYEYRIESSPYDEFYGVAIHGDDVPIVFASPLSNKLDYDPIDVWSSANYNYSSYSKYFTQRMINYWANFAKYDNPNYPKTNLVSPADLEYWEPFVDRNIYDLNNMEASEKMNIGRYLWLRNKISMRTGFSNYKCDYWNYTMSSRASVTSTTTARFSTVLILILLSIINFYFKSL